MIVKTIYNTVIGTSGERNPWRASIEVDIAMPWWPCLHTLAVTETGSPAGR
jgi:hypothetical protein